MVNDGDTFTIDNSSTLIPRLSNSKSYYLWNGSVF